MNPSAVRKSVSLPDSGKTLALLVLTSAIATANSVMAETGSSDNRNELTLKLRNYYQDRRPTNPGTSYIDESGRTVTTQKKQVGWGQGLEINFDSAYLGEEQAGVGFDFSLYGGLKLLGDSDLYGTTVNKEGTPYYDAGSQRYLAKQSNYAKVGQAYLKGFAGQDGQKASAKAGWHRIDRTLMKTYYRLTPTSFQGVSLDAGLGNVDLYGSWYNKVSRYNSDRFENITSAKPGTGGSSGKHEEIKYAYTVGGSFSHESGLGSELAYAESESYLKLYHANLNYTVNLDQNTALLLEGQYYRGEGNGSKWKDSQATYGGFDDSASLYNLNARLSYDMLVFKASYSQVDAEKQNGLGVFDYHLGRDSGRDYDSLGYWTKRQISDFNHNGEKTLQVGAACSFDKIGAPGLMLGYTYTQGSDIKTNSADSKNKYRESEHNVELGYDFQQEQLRGLSFRLQYASYKADKELRQIKNSAKQGYSDDGMTDLRVFVDYTLSVF